MDEREKKLPKWAQDTIEALRREVDAKDRTIKTLQWDHPNTNTVLQSFLDDGDKALPKNACVKFYLGRPQDGRTAITVRLADDYSAGRVLEVMGIGGGGLMVMPSAANVIRVVVGP